MKAGGMFSAGRRCTRGRPTGGLRPRRSSQSLTGVFVAVFVTAVSLCGRGVEAVSSGTHHSCSAFDDGTVKCWGLNTSGQLGYGDLVSRGSSPADMGDALEDVDLGEDFFAAGVSCGFDHTCAWAAGGRMKCWGGNLYGQLGYGDKTDRGGTLLSMGDDLPFVSLGTGVSVLYAVAANQFTCMLLSDDTVKCFGRNDSGQLGSGNSADNRGDGPDEMGDELPRVQLATSGATVSVSSLAARSGPCVIMTTNAALGVALKCWGPNGYGSLGLGDDLNRGDDSGEMGENLPPIPLGTGVTPSTVVTGLDFACMLSTDGRVKCWGRSPNGQCGSGNVETYGDDPGEMGDNLAFLDLGTGVTVSSLSAGEAHVCAALDNGSVKCWGKGYYGATGHESWFSTGQVPGQMGDALPTVNLGNSSVAASSSSRRLRGNRILQQGGESVEVSQLSAGGQRSCAIVDGGSLKCWGRGWAGALGLGDSLDRGSRSGTMGDSLPTLSVGTDKVAVSPSPASSETISPTPGPTVPPTPAPTPPPTTKGPTMAPAVTPAPTPQPTTAGGESQRDGFEKLTDDVGISVIQGIAIVVGVPIIALLCCCWMGYVVARKKNDKSSKDASNNYHGGSSRALGGDGPAAPIAPASTVSSRNCSRNGSRIGSRIGSEAFIPSGAEVFFSTGANSGKKHKVAEETASISDKVAENGVFGLGAVSTEDNECDYDNQSTRSGMVSRLGSTRSSKSNCNGYGSSSGLTPGKIKAALTPSFCRRSSSSETPPNTWSGKYQVQPIDDSGSFTPESNAAGSAFSRHEDGASVTRHDSQLSHHSRNNSTLSRSGAESAVAVVNVVPGSSSADGQAAPSS